MKEPEFRCHVTGEITRPLGVGTPELAGGARFAWWTCPMCDRDEHRRSDVGFDASRPGCHVVFLDPIGQRPTLRWSFRKQETSQC